jgi:hypothetical protein
MMVAPIDPNPPPHPGEPWGPAERFDVLDVPAFPLEVLSPWLGEWAHAIADFCQVPADLPATVGLSTLSLGVSRRFHVRVVRGWDEPTNIYTVTALPPAERKSPVFSKATAPLHTYQAELAAELAPRIAARNTERKILMGQIEAATAAAVKGGGTKYAGTNPQQDAIELSARLADRPELAVPGLVADDITPEALAVLLGQSDERIGIFSAEGGPFEIMNGRYSEKGGNFELFLKAHPGDPHTVNRIRREPVSLKHPLVAMAITVQPTVIQGLAAKEGFRGLGLLARFLYSLPRSIVGLRLVETPEVPEEIERRYHRAIANVLRLAGSDRLLPLSPEAHRARCDFQAELEPRLGDDGDLEPIRDWAGKLTGAVCRLAGILHVGDHALDFGALPETIPLATFERAIALGRYFLAHALGAFQVMGADEETQMAKRLWAWIVRKEIVTFTERDAQRAVHADKAESIKPGIAKLVERYLVRELPNPPTGGRPASPPFEVNVAVRQ